MEQKVKRWLMYLALGTALALCASAMAFLLLCGVTPSVTVYNNSPWPLSSVQVTLPSNSLRFDAIGPNEEQRIFYDANQADGVYRIELERQGKRLSTECGYVTHGEWGKRLQVIVDETDHIQCREQLHY
ncbi:hypothetical protein [Simiduia aestuariiviva]|uniref:Lipoprotein n=1 Tax=Simiduia aestuariiviva TaxID=1510459 RepID=A0A839UI64_9GAMM|nr:hypothetical protein [Simiduia aestuariiviva]MBB3167744.1 hypothetical protein [Simiduia aestuariiviva]